MLPVERHRAITDAVTATGVVSTEALVALLAVSAETVRRDLAVLEERGVIHRVHGGAATAATRGSGEEPSFTVRSTTERDAKTTLARVAVELLRNGQTVVIDIGTTAVEVARAIPHDFRGTVATPSLLVATELADRPGIELLVCGGRVRGGDLSCANGHAKAFFADLYADIAFLGSGGVAADVGLTDFHLDEVEVKTTIIANSAHSYVLADSSKLGRVSPHRVCALSALDGIITDSTVPDDLSRAIADAGGIIASPEITDDVRGA
ncbi:DeoR/GlpR family DNA-binding transcription regulator [Mycobacterium sp. AZCC_0083]|uniref:DeoR/GlpR family DNA-binding transcription regulator n=1 Tax=Mycobacterium sp. AZCC_0083 TaxID=2735882 RepID=UPI0016087F33|nr:DeoR/GlpR family DNA-binding transcription regulator [Mycobacterium sp. AZCC_0083]MBB5165552.1 DeoR family glycerol-3-phosphate regulon repressor [Mycobacterium sp. AZCC_0083]